MNHSGQWVYLFYQTVVLKVPFLSTGQLPSQLSLHISSFYYCHRETQSLPIYIKFLCFFSFYPMGYTCAIPHQHTTCCFPLISNHILSIQHILVQPILILIKWLKFLTVGRKESFLLILSINTLQKWSCTGHKMIYLYKQIKILKNPTLRHPIKLTYRCQINSCY